MIRRLKKRRYILESTRNTFENFVKNELDPWFIIENIGIYTPAPVHEIEKRINIILVTLDKAESKYVKRYLGIAGFTNKFAALKLDN